MRYIDYLREQDPSLKDVPDSEIVTAFARSKGVSLDEAAEYLGTPIERYGFAAGLKQGGGAMIAGLGSWGAYGLGFLRSRPRENVLRAIAESIPDPRKAALLREEARRYRDEKVAEYMDNPLVRYGQEVQFFNAGPQDLESVKSNLAGSATFTLGNVASYVLPSLLSGGAAAVLRGAGMLGRAAGGVARGVSSAPGQLGLFSLPSAGEIAERQIEAGDVDPVRFAGGALLSGAMERLTGPERFLLGPAKGLLPKSTALGTVARRALQGAAEETVQEMAQTTVESYAGSREAPTQRELELSAAMGALGGFMGGGVFSIPEAMGKPLVRDGNKEGGDPAVNQALADEEVKGFLRELAKAAAPAPQVQYGRVQPEPMAVPPEVEQALRSADKDVVEFKGVLPRVFHPSTEQVYRPSPAAHIAALGEAAVPSASPYGRESVTPHPVEPLPGPAGADEAIRQAEAVEFGNVLARVFNPPSGEVITPSPGLHSAVVPSQEVSPATARRFAPLTRGRVQPEPLITPSAAQQELARANAIDFAGILANVYGPQEPYTPHPAVHLAALGQRSQQAKQETPSAVPSKEVSPPAAQQPPGESPVSPIDLDSTTVKDFIPLYLQARREMVRGGTKNKTAYFEKVLKDLNLPGDATLRQMVAALAENIDNPAVDRQLPYVDRALKKAGLPGVVEIAEQAIRQNTRVSALLNLAENPEVNDDLIEGVRQEAAPVETETASEYLENVVLPFLSAYYLKRRVKAPKGGKNRKSLFGSRERLAEFIEAVRRVETGEEGLDSLVEEGGKKKDTQRKQFKQVADRISEALEGVPSPVSDLIKETMQRLISDSLSSTRQMVPTGAVTTTPEEVLTGETPVEAAAEVPPEAREAMPPAEEMVEGMEDRASGLAEDVPLGEQRVVGAEAAAEGTQGIRIRERSLTSGEGTDVTSKPVTETAKQISSAAQKIIDGVGGALKEEYELKRKGYPDLPAWNDIPDGLAKDAFLLAVQEDGGISDRALALLDGMLKDDIVGYADFFKPFSGGSRRKAVSEDVKKVLRGLFPSVPADHFDSKRSLIRVFDSIEDLEKEFGKRSPIALSLRERDTAVAAVFPTLQFTQYRHKGKLRGGTPRTKATDAPAPALVIIANRAVADEKFLRGLIMHEIGAHIGLQRLLGPNNLSLFAREVERWASRGGDARNDAFASSVAEQAVARAKASINRSLEARGLKKAKLGDAVIPHLRSLRSEELKRAEAAKGTDREAKHRQNVLFLDKLLFTYDAEVLAYTASLMGEMGVFDSEQIATLSQAKETRSLVDLIRRLIGMLRRLISRALGLPGAASGLTYQEVATVLYAAAHHVVSDRSTIPPAAITAVASPRGGGGRTYYLTVDMPVPYRSGSLRTKEHMVEAIKDVLIGGKLISPQVGDMGDVFDALKKGASVDRYVELVNSFGRAAMPDAIHVRRYSVAISDRHVLDLRDSVSEMPDHAVKALRALEAAGVLESEATKSGRISDEYARDIVGNEKARSILSRHGIAAVIAGKSVFTQNPLAESNEPYVANVLSGEIVGYPTDLPLLVQRSYETREVDLPMSPDVPTGWEQAKDRLLYEIEQIRKENPSLSFREALEQSERFRQWYKGPTKDGRPVVFYHYSKAPVTFSEFAENNNEDDLFHFGTARAARNRFHDVRKSLPKSRAGFTIPVYLSAAAPIVGPDLGSFRDRQGSWGTDFLHDVGLHAPNGTLSLTFKDMFTITDDDRVKVSPALAKHIRQYVESVLGEITDDKAYIRKAVGRTIRAFEDSVNEGLGYVGEQLYMEEDRELSTEELLQEYASDILDSSPLPYGSWDSYVYPNRTEGDVSVAVTEPSQIKSIFATTFSDSTADILFADVFDGPSDGIVETIVRNVPPQLRRWSQAAVDAAQNIAKKGLYAAAFTPDLVRMVKDVLPSALRLEHIRQKQDTRRRIYVGKAEMIMQDFVNLKDEERDRVQKLLYDATVEQKWPVRPIWRGDDEAKKVEVDEALARRFEALSPEAKSVVRRVLEFEDNIWHDKYAAIMSDVDQQEQQNITDMEEEVRQEYAEKLSKAKTDEEKSGLMAEMEKEIERRTMEIKEEAAKQRKQLQEQLPARLPGPYVPLMRHGRYAVVGMSEEMARALDEGKVSPDMLRDPEHYWVEFHDSFAKAKARQRELEEVFDTVDAFERAKWERPIDQMPVFAYRKILEAFSQVEGPALRRKMRASLHDLYVTSLADSAAQKARLRRQYVAGFDYRDVMTTFARRAESDARFITNVVYGRESAEAMQQMRREAMARKAPVEGKRAGREERLRVYNEMAARYSATIAHESAPWINAGLSVSSFWMLLSSPAYYLQNLTQPIMMSAPYMVGRFKVGEVKDAFIQAYKDVAPLAKTAHKEWLANLVSIKNRSGILYDKSGGVVGERDKLMLEHMLNKGILDIGIDTEMGTLLDTHPALQPAAKLHMKLVRLARRVEIINRTSTALAAYRLASASGMNHEEALAYTEDVLRTTHGDYSQHAAPRVFLTNVGRLALQFRKFQLIQITMLAKLFHTTFKGESKAERQMAARALIATLSQALLVTGIRGLPGWALLGWLLKLLLEDEEPYNLDQKTYKALNDLFGKGFADMLINGVPSLVNANLTSRIGWGNVFSLFPYTDIDLSSRDGLAKALLAASGPLIGGLGANVAEGLGLMRLGLYHRGLELMLPRGLRDTMRAYRFATEGLATRRGEVLIPDEDISVLDTFMQLLGFPSHKVSKAYLRRSIMIEMESHFQSISTRLRTRYLMAWRQGDREAMREIEARWREVNDARARYGFRRRPIKDLRNIIRESRRRERQTVGAVPYKSSNRRAAEELARTI